MSDVDLDSQDSWSIARQYANLLNPIPASVSDCISNLWNTHAEHLKRGEQGFDEPNVEAIRRVDKTAKLKAPLYFAAQSLFADRFAELKEDDSSKALLKILGPGLFAAFLGLVYIQRRLNKLCASPEHANWPNYSKELVLNMELGFLLGSSFQKLSPADGTIANGIRYAALSCLFLHSPLNYSKYRNLRKQKLILEEEHQRWGCDHAQIGAYLLRMLGYKSDVMESVVALRKLAPQKYSLPPDLASWSASLSWIDVMKEKLDSYPGDEAVIALGADDNSLREMRVKVNALLQKGASFEWMLKAKEA